MAGWRQVVPLVAVWSLFLVVTLEYRMGAQVSEMRQQNQQLASQLSVALGAPPLGVPPAPASFLAEAVPHEDPIRRLASIYTLGTAATSGCFEVSGGADMTKDLSSATCSGSAKCPACFFASSLDNDISLTISACSTAIVAPTGTTSYTGLREFVFINGDAADTLTVTDGTNSFLLGPMNMVYATCYSSGSDKLYFQSNYGVAGSNVATCPDGCDSATPMKSSDSTTAFTLVPALTAAQKTRIGYLTNADVGANVVWGGENVGFTAAQTTRIGYLTNADVGANVVWGGENVGFTAAQTTRLGYLTTNDVGGAVTWGGQYAGFASADRVGSLGYLSDTVISASLEFTANACTGTAMNVCQQ